MIFAQPTAEFFLSFEKRWLHNLLTTFARSGRLVIAEGVAPVTAGKGESMRTGIFVWAILFGSISCASADFKTPATKDDKALFDQWAKITTPLLGTPAAIGFYSAGCIAGAQKLPGDGTGYAIMRPSRNRFYGHPKLLEYLTGLAAKTRQEKMPFMLIGDMGPPRGGPMLSGHASHQDGLDSDIWFMMLAKKPSARDREKLSALSYVSGRKKLKKTWGSTQVKMLTAAADNDEVNRIFVSPPIKKYFCQKFPKAAWLYRLRPWWGHEEHFHVRLQCPADSPLCKPQEALDPTNSGCGSDLDWWFSKEADDEWAKITSSTEPRAFPTLPPECDAMLK